MQYILLKNGKGIIHSDSRKSAENEITLTFTNAPSNSTAIFGTSKGQIYRRLSEDKHECSLNCESISGVVTVGISTSNVENGEPQRWYCESLLVTEEKDGRKLNSPLNDFGKEIEFLYLELEIVQKHLKELTEKMSSLEKQLEDTLDGHDFI